jgi:prepilin-type N-terminal cleavage/methylation domain-containing protein
MKKQGFSLVELSIVLVILGLLTGGILTGQNLIRAAELRSVTTQIAGYRTALYSFRDKYFAIPGDMVNATDFWGAVDGADGEGSDCFDAESLTQATCNGTGDGKVAGPTGSAGTSWRHGERFHSWKHLANAGLIEGSYTGKSDHATNYDVKTAGKNVPAAKAGNGLFILAQSNSGAQFFPRTMEQGMLIGLEGTGGYPLTPAEAWNIDKKLDDGKPGYGVINTPVGAPSGTWAPDCATTDVDATAEYHVTHEAAACPLYVLMQ